MSNHRFTIGVGFLVLIGALILLIVLFPKEKAGPVEAGRSQPLAGVSEITIKIPLITRNLAEDEVSKKGDQLEYHFKGFYVPSYRQACDLKNDAKYHAIGHLLQPLCLYSNIANEEPFTGDVLARIFNQQSCDKIARYMEDEVLKKNIILALKSMQEIQPRLIVRHESQWLAFCRVKQANSEIISIYKIVEGADGGDAKLSNEGELKEPFIQNIISAAQEQGFESMVH